MLVFYVIVDCSNLLSIIIILQFFKDGEWWTWIDYDKYDELAAKFKASGGQATFTSADYMARTPSWAVVGAQEKGFDPSDTRFFRKKRKDISGC